MTDRTFDSAIEGSYYSLFIVPKPFWGSYIYRIVIILPSGHGRNTEYFIGLESLKQNIFR